MTGGLRHRRVTANGIKIHYVDVGAPVVLLHGFPFTWYAWRHQIPVLSESYRLIAPDLRGYGATERPLMGYDKRSMALDLKGLLDARGIDVRRSSGTTAALVLERDSQKTFRRRRQDLRHSTTYRRA